MPDFEKPSSNIPGESSPSPKEMIREKFLEEIMEKAEKLGISEDEYLARYAKNEQNVRETAKPKSSSDIFELPNPSGPTINSLLHDNTRQEIVTEQQKTVIEQSKLDTLTGLYSLKSYNEELERRNLALRKAKTWHQRQTDLKETEKKPEAYSILYLDIDHFKSVNDTYGHPMGDKVIHSVADAIKECIRNTDFPARIGGEEMSVILSGSDVNAAALVADRIRKLVESLVFTIGKKGEEKKFSVTVSIGVADYIENSEHHRSLSDAALQAAKGNEVACEAAINGTGLKIFLKKGEKIPEDEDTRNQVWYVKDGVLLRYEKPEKQAQ